MDDARKKVEALLRKNILVTPEMMQALAGMPLEEVEKMSSGPLPESSPIDIIFSYSDSPKKRDCQDFVSYFNSRFKQIEKILLSRPELQSVTAISRLKLMQGRSVSIIGMIKDKQVTKNGNIMMTLEDQTGTARIIVNKNKPGAFLNAKDSVCDEVVGISGQNNGEVIFVNSYILPDIPLQEARKSPEECYAIFMSDLHVGSKKFLRDEFERFLGWIRGETGSEEQRKMASKVKYIIIAGDIVDGVGIYPYQQDELELTDIYDQYSECARLLSRIPEDKKIIISPGNHDSVRISEPQPAFSGEIAAPLLKLPNLYPVSNPAYVTIGKRENFHGIDILIYHGYSFDHYAANVESIRAKGGYGKGDLIMKFLLQRRHLSPEHSSTLYLPVSNDNLVISRVPDIFATGHIHRTNVAQYKHVTLISSSCWQGRTAFQEKTGHKPEPARVPIVNLKTREVRILKFGEGDE